MKNIKTYRQLVDLDNMVGGLYQRNPLLKVSKFGYAYKRFADKSLKKVFDLYNEELAMIRIDNALVNEVTKAVILTGIGRGFEYNKEGLKNVIREEIKLSIVWETKEFEIEPYFTKDLPENLSDDEKELMQGIIIE